RAQMIKRLLNIMQEYMHDGGVSFVAQGMDVWCNVMNADEANNAPAIGLAMDKHSVTGEAIRNKRSEFAIHFNNSPKQLSPREHSTDGATLAIPLMMNGRQQGAVLAYDKNALIFKESTKHKLSNLVRVAGLQIMANDPSIDIHQPLFTTVSGAYLPDIWRSTVDAELEERSTRQPAEDSWFGLITLSNLAELRTKMRMEQLEQMQQDLVSTFNPCLYGYNGILGYHSDYLYTFFIQDSNPDAVDKWVSSIRAKFTNSFELRNGMHIKTDIRVGSVQLTNDFEDSYDVLKRAKSALSQVMDAN